MTNSLSSRNFPLWRFLLPFSLQLAVILFIPIRSVYTYNFGTKAVIQTMPVDPYDFLRGYSQTLGYDISQVDALKKLPGGKDLTRGEQFYVILQSAPSSTTPPLPWQAIEITSEIPSNIPENRIAIKGKIDSYRTATYGLETYYMPENQRDKINQEISKLQRQPDGRRAFVVEVKVDRWGNAVPLSLWIGQQNYRF
ncbi:GDYXXLXY domain-containing protein [Pleurocapsa sp. PCC 7319]|uniref:GDYXXLXY domain-containing protein n=1 Tax=Pleurocapsa sp. PCC 7319 TaxID=118161 RepID=UPI00034A3345|nr:GDYXXLXY domain-containing protein [Pleurocapsa sp. PCC 7319]